MKKCHPLFQRSLLSQKWLLEIYAITRKIGCWLYRCEVFLTSFYDLKQHIKKLVGSSAWSIEHLTKPLIFIVDNSGWEIRCALLSTFFMPTLSRIKRST
jgi:hypothetical protein